MIIIFKLLLIFVRIYTLLFLSVNMYYLRDDIKIIYNPKVLIIHLKQILKTVM